MNVYNIYIKREGKANKQKARAWWRKVERVEKRCFGRMD